MDIAYFDNLFKPGKAGELDNERYWDNRACHFSTSQHNHAAAKEHMFKLNSLLTEKGILTGNSTILDVGCGPGNYSLQMAKTCKEVVGIDISAEMLAYAEKNKKDMNLNNLNFMKADWNMLSLGQHNWEKHFDLVFASMCPAINSKEALEKMIMASKNYCFASFFAHRQESIRDKLAEILVPDWEMKKQRNSVYCCFNLLWLMGYYPEIIYVDSCWNNSFSLEEAVQYYSRALPVPDSRSESTKKAIRDCLLKEENQGLIKEKVRAKFAWIYWKV